VSLNLIKMSVGVASVDRLRTIQTHRRAAAKIPAEINFAIHRTRFMPRRAEEILASGGSIYWIIRGRIRARQRIVGFLPGVDADGRRFVHIQLDPELVKTVPNPRDPLQGWRYLEEGDAPPDIDDKPEGTEAMPAEMVAELRELGLL
jgi:hypothetical protein